MPEGGDGFTGDLQEQVSEKDSQQKLQECKWKNCKGKHRAPPQYPDSGNVARSGVLEKNLDDKNQRPWKGGSRNRPTRPVYVDHPNQGGRIIIREQEAWEQEGRIWYKTQAHHLIPIELMKKLTTLPHNAKLVGWNIDDAENGIFLPEFWQDIAIHGLQAHDGDHPDTTYKTPINSLLKNLEKQFEERCDGTEGAEDISAQKVLASNLEVISKRARRKILEIATNPTTSWKLHYNSVIKYNESFARYLEVEQRYQEQQRANRQVPQLPHSSSSS